MNSMRWLCAVFLSLLFMVQNASAQLPPPPITSAVTDQTRSLSNAGRTTIEAALRAHQKDTQVQIAVLLISSTSGEPIEDYAHRAATAWRGGKKAQDLGILVVLATADHKSRIEVGYGLEARISDAKARAILDAARTPLRASDFDVAITGICNALIGLTGGAHEAIELGKAIAPASQARAPAESARQTPRSPLSYNSAVLLVVAVTGSITVLLVLGFFWARRVADRRMAALDDVARVQPGPFITFFGSSSISTEPGFWASVAAWAISSSSSSSDHTSSASSSDGSSSSSFDSSSSSGGGNYGGGGGDFGGGGGSSDW